MKTERKVLVTTILQEQVVISMCLINPRTAMVDLLDTIKKCEEFAKEYFISRDYL